MVEPGFRITVFSGGNINDGGAVDKPESRIRIELTDDQRKQIREASGHDISTLDVTVTELEARIAPISLNYGGIKYTY